MNKLIALFFCLSFCAAIMASPVSDAVAAGKIKELSSGYVESVDMNPDISKLVEKVNKGRKAKYEQIAKKNGLSVEQVGKASYEKRFK